MFRLQLMSQLGFRYDPGRASRIHSEEGSWPALSSPASLWL